MPTTGRRDRRRGRAASGVVNTRAQRSNLSGACHGLGVRCSVPPQRGGAGSAAPARSVRELLPASKAGSAAECSPPTVFSSSGPVRTAGEELSRAPPRPVGWTAGCTTRALRSPLGQGPSLRTRAFRRLLPPIDGDRAYARARADAGRRRAALPLVSLELKAPPHTQPVTLAMLVWLGVVDLRRGGTTTRISHAVTRFGTSLGLVPSVSAGTFPSWSDARRPGIPLHRHYDRALRRIGRPAPELAELAAGTA